MTPTVNYVLSILTVAGQAAGVGLLIALLLKPEHPYRQYVCHLLPPLRLIQMAFILSLSAALGSLFYSDIAGYIPCTLCWYQRVFMYPQVILFGAALWKRDNHVWLYSIPLSVAGGVIATYQYYLQLGGNPLIPCAKGGYASACAQRFVMEFGYITIPLMAATVFVLLILLGISATRKPTTSSQYNSQNQQ